MTLLDFFVQNLWVAWLLVSLFCLILELTNGDFFIMSFAVGALGASVSSLFTDSLIIQTIVFAILTVLSVLYVRPLALKYLHRGEDKRVSNTDALIGRVGRVTEPIGADGYGRVQIDGDSWKARMVDGSCAGENVKVRVLSLDSIIITVEKV